MPKKKAVPETPVPETVDEIREITPAESPQPEVAPRKWGRRKKTEPAQIEEPVSPRQAFYNLDFKTLDKDLSPDERDEWDAIYASFRAGSILTGRVTGVDSIRVGDDNVICLVVFAYRVKILIPYPEVWAEERSRQKVNTLRRFLGAEVDYVIREVDREGNCAVASRAQAVTYRRKAFNKRPLKPGDLVDCRVLAVSTTVMLLECGGYETTLRQKAISYGTILDLREDYRPGQTVKAVFKGLENDSIKLSVKEVNPHPFDGIESRHPLHSRRLSRIMGKYAGGVFCELEKGFSCMCLYAPGQRDEDFSPGDNVIIAVTKFDYGNRLVYGRIVSGW
jgi:ribosomal protein S1